MTDSLDRFANDKREIVYCGKDVLITRVRGKDGATLDGYVRAKDPAGNEYFAFEGYVRDPGEDGRGEGLVLMTLINELKAK